ncbi:TonB-dependent receptor [Roseiterribacter gracilis]|uniref:TonB-dependent receptor n=1 Tax=Roseiterribacter gracilis TaxID=2812848 RepID=UPI003B427FDC
MKQRVSRGLSAFGRRASLGGASLAVIAACLAAAPAMAQTGGPEEIVVTGFRSSLARSLNVKKVENAQVDTILAEDIGKFPDLNLSESIQRIPGVALARDAGEGRNISVRGLNPTFTRVRVNGMEALSTTGSSDAAGGVNRGRAFDFNVFASDLFNSITVRKTSEAEVEEGSLGATVDLRTARPFDYGEFTAVASLRGSYNDLSESAGPRLSAMVANNWNDKFGVLGSIAYSKRNLLDVGTSTVRWAQGNAFAPGFASAPPGFTLAQVNGALHPRFPRYDLYTQESERTGATGSMQWRPTEKALITFDALYANFKNKREEQYLEAPSFSTGGACTAANTATSCGIAQTAVTAAKINSNNELIAGTFNNVDLRVEDRYDELDTKFYQYSLTGEYEVTSKFKVDAMAGHSKSDFKNPIQTTLTYDQFNVQNYSYDYSLGRAPLLNYGSARLTDPSAWTLTQIRERPQTAVNKFDTMQGNAKYELDDWITVKAGGDLKRYSYRTTELRRTNGTTANQEATIPAGIASIPISSFSGIANFPTQGLGVPAGTPTAWLVPSLSTAVSALSLYDQAAFNGAFRLGPEPALANNAGVDERDKGGYAQADFRFHPFGMTLRGNVGVRYVNTSQSAQGYSFVSGAPVAIIASRDYSNTLPSLNLALEPREDLVFRFAAAKVMARPNLGNLTPGATVSVSGSARTVTAGNPNLNPFSAKAYDVSGEWYYDKGALFGVALFQKDISSFVQTVTTNQAFTGNSFGLPDAIAVAACGAVAGCSPSAQWAFSTPVNAPGGTLQGIEVNWQQPFKFLPGLLSNTGMLLNYTNVRSSVSYLNSAGVVVATNSLTGLSRQSYNATLYYEDDKWSARVSAAYRSKYLTRVPGQETGTDVDGTNSTLNVDASIQYTVNRNLKITFEAINLTDEFQDQFNNSTNLVSFYHHTGREFLFGVRLAY